MDQFKHINIGKKPREAEPVRATRFCENCGSPILDGNAFCTECGASVPVQAVTDNAGEQKKQRPVWLLPALIGGGAVLLAALVLLILRPWSKPKSEPLALQFEEPSATETTAPTTTAAEETGTEPTTAPPAGMTAEEYLAQAEQAGTRGDYANAIFLLDSGLSAYPDAGALQDRREVYVREKERKDTLLDRVSRYREKDNYAAALSVLGDEMALYPDDADYPGLYESCTAEYRAQVLSDAALLASDGDYEQAVREIDGGLKVLKQDAELLRARDQYDAAWKEQLAAEEAAAQLASEQAAAEATRPDEGVPPTDYFASGMFYDALQPDSYMQWTYDRDMTFAYPMALYHRSDMDTTSYAVIDGENEVTYSFSSDTETRNWLAYQKVRANQGISGKTIVSDWYEYQKSALVDCETLAREEGSNPRYVIVGYTDEDRITESYEVGRWVNGAFFRMVVHTPNPTNDEERRMRDYVVECLYRLCSFSGSPYDGCRSYSEFS